jgi:outer membrane protein TolC
MQHIGRHARQTTLPLAIVRHPGGYVALSVVIPGLLLAACAVGPDFETPMAPNVGGYAREHRLGSTDSAPTSGGNAQAFAPGGDLPGDWWALLHSRQLNAFVEEAVRNHPDVQAAQFALRSASETVLARQGS